MTGGMPQFHVAHVYQDDRGEAPELIPVTALPGQTRMDRRGFLGAGIGIAAVLGLGGCSGNAPAGTWPGGRTGRTDCGGANAHVDSVRFLLAAQGGILVSHAPADTTKLWRLPGGTLVRVLERTGALDVVAVTPDARLVARSDSGGEVEVWSVADGERLRTFHTGMTRGIAALAFTPAGTLVCLGSGGGLQVWDVGDPPQRRSGVVLRDDTPRAMLVIDGAGARLAVLHPQGIGRWRLPGLEPAGESRTAVGQVHAATSDGRMAASAAQTRISTWDLAAPRIRRINQWHASDGVSALAISPDGGTVVSGDQAGDIHLWEASTGALLQTLPPVHLGEVVRLAITQAGDTLVAGYPDGKIWLWSLPAAEFRTCLVDLQATAPYGRGLRFQQTDDRGQTVAYTQACGSRIPRGAVCTCNCVPGTYVSRVRPGRQCSCVPVCTCVPVRG